MQMLHTSPFSQKSLLKKSRCCILPRPLTHVFYKQHPHFHSNTAPATLVWPMRASQHSFFRFCLHLLPLPCSLESALHHLSCSFTNSTLFLCWALSLTWLTSSPKQLICLVPLLQSYNVLLEKLFDQPIVATKLWLFKFLGYQNY